MKDSHNDKIASLEQSKPHVSAIIAAAGISSRMEGHGNKQFLLIGGRPVITWTLAAFQRATTIDEVIVVCRSEDIVNVYDIVKYYDFTKVISVVGGGNTRQQSVFAGIKELRASTDYIAIHDGARPLIRPETIDAVVTCAFENKAAITGVPTVDTIKEVSTTGMILRTVDRSRMWNVQTPQVFARELYFEAMQKADDSRVDFTDDCQLVENLKKAVYMVEGSYSNFKITTAQDIALANKIIEERESCE